MRGPGTRLELLSTGAAKTGVRFSYENSSGIAGSLIATSTNGITRNQPHHIVGTHDGSTAILYIDGIEIQRATGITGTRSLSNSAPEISASLWPTAIIDEVAWYPAALSPVRVLAHYNAGIASGYDVTIDQDNPVSHWKMGETTQATDRKGGLNLPVVGGSVEVVKGLVANNGSDSGNYFEQAPSFELVPSTNPVSYTHLTLPTILRV